MEKKMNAAIAKQDGWEGSSDEEEDYDYGKECTEVFLKRR